MLVLVIQISNAGCFMHEYNILTLNSCRDISFLYDVALVEPPLSKANSKDPSSIRVKERPKEEVFMSLLLQYRMILYCVVYVLQL